MSDSSHDRFVTQEIPTLKTEGEVTSIMEPTRPEIDPGAVDLHAPGNDDAELASEALVWPRRRGLLIGLIAGGVAVLAAAAAIAVPMVSHAVRVTQYAEHMAAIEQAGTAQAEADADLLAAVALVETQYVEAVEFAGRLKALGRSLSPVLTAEQAGDLTLAGDELLEALGESTAEEPGRAKTIETFTAAVEELRQTEAAEVAEATDAANEADASYKDQAESVVPAFFLEVGIPEVRAIAFDTQAALPLKRVADAGVTGDIVDQARKQAEKSQDRVQDRVKQIETEQGRSAAISEAIAGTLPALTDAAAGASIQAQAVSAVSGSAGKAVLASVTKTAAEAERAAGADATSALELEADLSAYVQAAKAAVDAHAAAIAAAEVAAAEAAAAASGAGGYENPSTGQWTPVSGGNGGWSNGGGTWSGGGGAPSDGGGSSGGWDPNYVPGGGGCQPPPAGWFPTGGTANGCPTYLPPGGGDTEGW